MEKVAILLKYNSGGSSYQEKIIHVDVSFTGAMLKVQIFSLTNIHPDDQIVFVAGKLLQDNEKLDELSLKSMQTVVMNASQKAVAQTIIKTGLTEDNPLLWHYEVASRNRPAQRRKLEDYYTIKSTENANAWFAYFHSFRRPIDEYSQRAVRPDNVAKVAILDSGIDMSHEKIAELKGNIKGLRNFLDEHMDDIEDSDSNRHGTQVALLLLNEAPFADIYIARIKKDRCSPLMPGVVAKAIDYATDTWDVDILCMSWGFTSRQDNVAQAIERASQKGKIMFAAASNTGANLPKEIEVTFPANMPDVICINSTDGFGDKSNFNPPPRKGHYNFSTLGEAVLESWEPGKRESGTSFATPLAAAIAASFIEFLRQGEMKRFKLPDRFKEEVRTRDGMLKILAGISRDSGGFSYLQPWSLLQCTAARGKCPDKCRQVRENAGQKISNILRDILLRPADLAVIDNTPVLAHVDAADVRAHSNEYEPRCIPGTRAEIIRQITSWANGNTRECICWLSGRLGTGKSTIARTVALQYAEQGHLGGTFLFSRNQKNLRTLTFFVSSLAHQLGHVSPSLKLAVSKAKSDDAEIEQLAISIQWKRLIYNPLSSLDSRDTPIIFVIDALDECEALDIDKITGIINLFTSAAALQNVALRFLITSRPEMHIQTAFKEFQNDIYHIALDDLDRPSVDQDISRIFEFQFKNLPRGVRTDWPSQKQMDELVERSNGLFIYAAMVCRYLKGLAGDNTISINARLTRVFQDQTFDTLDNMYNNILMQSVAGGEAALTKQLKMILGVIIALFEPMSELSLCKLCPEELEFDVMCSRLDSLRSVLVIPLPELSGDPVYISHHSFREFLLKRREGSHMAWINEKAHQDLTTTCIRLLSNDSASGLRKDICSIKDPGTEMQQVDVEKINSFITIHTRYACRYWIYHLKELDPIQRQEIGLSDHGAIHKFLENHLLHWLEVLCWLGKVFEGLHVIQMLGGMIDDTNNPQLYAFVKDAERFILYNREIIEIAPLQVYCSALVFAPQQSLVRKQFAYAMPSWISKLSGSLAEWPLIRTTLVPSIGYHEFAIFFDQSVEFSDDGELVVSIVHTTSIDLSSKDTVITRVWDASTGKLLNEVNSLFAASFSAKAKLVLLANSSDNIDVADAASGGMRTGRFLRTLDFMKRAIRIDDIIFSTDNRYIVVEDFFEGMGVSVWNVDTGLPLHERRGCQTWKYSQELNLLAVIESGEASVFDVTNSAYRYSINNCQLVAFSPDGVLAAVQAPNLYPLLFDAATGDPMQDLLNTGLTGDVQDIVFSSDGRFLILIPTFDKNFLLWDRSLGRFWHWDRVGQGYFARAVFSPDNSVIASTSTNSAIRLWNMPSTALTLWTQKKIPGSGITSVAISPDGNLVASATEQEQITIWDAEKGFHLQSKVGGDRVNFLSNDKLITFGRKTGMLCCWHIASLAFTELIYTTKRPIGCPAALLQISPNYKMIAAANDSEISSQFYLLDAKTGKGLWAGVSDWGVSAIAFSHDSKYVAFSRCLNSARVSVYDVMTRGIVQRYEAGLWESVSGLAFSTDEKLIAQCYNIITRTYTLRELTTDTTLHRLDPEERVEELFLSNTKTGYVMSNRGSLCLDSRESETSDSPAEVLFVSNTWVKYKGRNVLWLPPVYRSNNVAVRDHLVVLGYGSGVIFMKFDFDKMYRGVG
ncbi:hypothetical protein F4777DRAFT_582348 [Nemania sp. FL0916]|nr:hypothetical protein F4777DRAFT_582348 [Nemania sp. FL0916]